MSAAPLNGAAESSPFSYSAPKRTCRSATQEWLLWPVLSTRQLESAARAHLLVDKHEAIGEREAEQRRVRLPVHLCESSNEPLAEVLVVLKQEPQRLVDADVGVGEVLEPTPGDASVVLACSCGRVRRGGVMQRTHSVDSDGDLVQRHLLRTVSFHRGPRCVDLRLQRSEGGHVEQACVLALGLSRVLRSRQQRQGA